MERITEKLIGTLSIEKEEKELIKYGLTAVLSTCFTSFWVFATGIAFNNLDRCVLFIVLFLPVRLSFESYHCKSMIRCTIISNIVIQTNVFIYNKILNLNNLPYALLGILISIFIAYIYYKNNKYLDRMKIISLLFEVMLLIIFNNTDIAKMLFICLSNIIFLFYLDDLKLF